MNPTKRNLLLIIIINIVLGLIVLAIPMRFWYSQQIVIKETIVRENKLENELTQSIKNFTELEKMYLELKQENIELKEQSDIVWDKYTITAYTRYDEGCNNITSIGIDLNEDWTKYFNFVAVDPKYIPYGKTIFIKINDEIIEALAVDYGYKIKGKRIDYYCNNLEEVYALMNKVGNKKVDVGMIK